VPLLVEIDAGSSINDIIPFALYLAMFFRLIVSRCNQCTMSLTINFVLHVIAVILKMLGYPMRFSIGGYERCVRSND